MFKNKPKKSKFAASTSFAIEPAMREFMDRKVDELGITSSILLRDALKEYLENHPLEIKVKKSGAQ